MLDGQKQAAEDPRVEVPKPFPLKLNPNMRFEMFQDETTFIVKNWLVPIVVSTGLTPRGVQKSVPDKAFGS